MYSKIYCVTNLRMLMHPCRDNKMPRLPQPDERHYNKKETAVPPHGRLFYPSRFQVRSIRIEHPTVALHIEPLRHEVRRLLANHHHL